MDLNEFAPFLNEFIEANAKLAFALGLILFVANYLFAYAMSVLSIFNKTPSIPRLLFWSTIEFLIILLSSAFIMFIAYILLGAEAIPTIPSPESPPLIQNQFALFLILIPYIAMVFLRRFITSKMLEEHLSILQGFAALIMQLTFFYLLPTIILVAALIIHPPAPVTP